MTDLMPRAEAQYLAGYHYVLTGSRAAAARESGVSASVIARWSDTEAFQRGAADAQRELAVDLRLGFSSLIHKAVSRVGAILDRHDAYHQGEAVDPVSDAAAIAASKLLLDLATTGAAVLMPPTEASAAHDPMADKSDEELRAMIASAKAVRKIAQD